MATLDELNQKVDAEVREFTDIDQLRPSISTVTYAMQYILAEGDKFSERDTLSILRALSILRGQLENIYQLRASVDVEKDRLASEGTRRNRTDI